MAEQLKKFGLIIIKMSWGIVIYSGKFYTKDGN